MISKWLEQAKRGQTVWLPDVREGCARMEDAVPVTMQLTLCDGSKRDFSLPLPRWQNEQEQQFVKQYVTACVYNTLSACSGREMAFYLDARESEAAALLGQLDEVFQVRRTAHSGYGKVINIADRLCRAFGGGRFAFAVRPQEDYSPAPDAAPVQGQLTERLRQAAARCGSGVCCGIDIGGTDIKAAVAADGRLVCVKEYDWNPAASPTAEGIIAPIELLVRLMACCAAGLTPALERALDKNAGDAVMAQAVAESLSVPLDVLGVSFPDVVIRDRIVGGETPKTQGMRSNPAADYEDAFAELGGLLERLQPLCREGAALHMTNDGHIAAFTAAAELAWSGKPDFSGGVIAHALGTDFGMGFLAPDGTIPEMPMELYDFLLDMGSFPQRELPADDLRSTRNENSGLPGARRYLGQAAAFRLAWDAVYGSVRQDDASSSRRGWAASRLAEYKLDWVTPGLYGWYTSGDNGNRGDGSERLPVLSLTGSDNDFSHFAFSGNPYIGREAAVGWSMAGTWGVGLRLKDISVIEDVKQTLRVNLIGGTNSPAMARRLSNEGLAANSGAFGAPGMEGLYLTTRDVAMEVGLSSYTKIYENMTVGLEASYIALWLDKSNDVWGASRMNGYRDDVRDAWNINFVYAYSF